MSRTESGKPPTRTARAPGTKPADGERVLVGIPVSPGIAIGAVYAASEPKLEAKRGKIKAGGVEAELGRLEVAVQKSRKQLAKLRARLGVLPEDSQHEIAPLIDAYLQMLGPSRLLRHARKRITDGLVTAETAVLDEVDALAAAMMALPAGRGRDDSAAQQRRADEIRETGRRLLRNLAEAAFRSFSNVPQGAILVAENLRPADAALIDPARIAGIANRRGRHGRPYGDNAACARRAGGAWRARAAGSGAQRHAGRSGRSGWAYRAASGRRGAGGSA